MPDPQSTSSKTRTSFRASRWRRGPTWRPCSTMNGTAGKEKDSGGSMGPNKRQKMGYGCRLSSSPWATPTCTGGSLKGRERPWRGTSGFTFASRLRRIARSVKRRRMWSSTLMTFVPWMLGTWLIPKWAGSSRPQPKMMSRSRWRNSQATPRGAHVDDTITGAKALPMIEPLQRCAAGFPFANGGRDKWISWSSVLSGSCYKRDLISPERSPIKLSKERARQHWQPATEKEISALRAVNGALGWLSSQSRPGLSVQTSLSQQCFPNPTVEHLLQANQAVRRARQHSDLEIRKSKFPTSNHRIWPFVFGLMQPLQMQSIIKHKVVGWWPSQIKSLPMEMTVRWVL